MKRFLIFFLSFSCLFIRAVEEPFDELNEEVNVLPDSTRFAPLKKNQTDEVESKPINWQNHFDESVQVQKKFQKKQKETVTKSKLLSEQPKTVRHSISSGLMFHDSDYFESKPINWKNLESNQKAMFEKKERSKILSKKVKKDVDLLEKRYDFKKRNSAQALLEEQKKIDEINALIDKAVWEINS